MFSGGPTKFYWDWGLCVAYYCPRTPLSAPARLLGIPSNCHYAHKPWLPLSSSPFLGLYWSDQYAFRQTTGSGGTAMHRHLFTFTWHWSPTQVKRATCPKKVSMTAQPAANRCYKIYFRGPRVFKRWWGNILKMQTCLPTWGGTQQHTSAEDTRTCHN